MDSKNNYHEEQNKLNTIKMRNVLAELPSFCRQFFRGIENNTSARTRLAYAYDLRVFFEYMKKNNSYCSQMEIKDFPLSILDSIRREDIEEYLEYVAYYQKDNREITNDERGKSRKLASLSSFYNYFYQSELIEKKPAALI
ncbi:MAG: integrase, partial [Kineothrix sp.]|nr:integrase [Kineothrix sp.]